MRRILCATDFSAPSARAFEHALVLASWYEAPLTVLHVAAEPMVASPLVSAAALPYPGGPLTLGGSWREGVEAELASLLGPANRAGLRATGEVREGHPATETVRVAQEIGADLIVMGTHGRTGFQRFMLGSVAETVLRRASCPVLTVPPRAADHPRSMFFKRILCASDFSPASEAAIRHATSLASEADASLFLVHVLDKPGMGSLPTTGHPDGNGGRPDYECAARAQLQRAVPPAAREFCRVEEIVAHGKAAAAILRQASERGVGLVVMGVHGRSMLDLMAFGSVTHDVVRQAECPVLTVRHRSG